MKRHFQVSVNGENFSVEVEEVGRGLEHLGPMEQLRPVVKTPVKNPLPAHQPVLTPRAALPEDNHTVTSPLPGTVVEIMVKAGQKVRAGQVLLIIEAMKMENEITAPAGGVVREVMVQDGASVVAGQPLIVLG